MTRLFIQFYIGVLAVLFGGGIIYGMIAQRQIGIELPRIVEVAHRGGAKLLAQQLNDVPVDARPEVLKRLREQFGFTQRDGVAIRIVPTSELASDALARISAGETAVFSEGKLATPLESGNEVLLLGPFPQFTHYERAMRGGTQLAVAAFKGSTEENQKTALADLSQSFGYGVERVETAELPDWEQLRIASGENTVFYLDAGEPFVLTPLADRSTALRFGPLPDYGNMEQRILAKSTAIVLLVAALAIAILLRPIARQLRRIEDAARAFSSGDLSVRVDESKVRSARPLAEAFNQMAGRTETLLRTQREILQTVSHELRTPLSKIRFAADLVGTARDDDERSQRLQSIDDAASELDELVGELLRYVRLESAEMTPECEELALDISFQTLIEQYSSLFPNVSFSSELATANSGISIRVAPTAFHRAIGNLLSNAGRYARDRVVLSWRTEENFVTISIDDDGPGISEEDRERVLEPFNRLEGNSETQGVGLGLAIVRRIVNQHGGSVAVQQSNLGGCRIETSWPAEKQTST